MAKFSVSARKKARAAVLQALYQQKFSDHGIDEIEIQFHTEEHLLKADKEYFHELLHGIIKQQSELDEKFTPFLDREISKLNPIELCILRLGTYELMFRKDIPYKVVINEGVELAKSFGAEQGHKYINGILDKVSQACRDDEAKNA